MKTKIRWILVPLYGFCFCLFQYVLLNNYGHIRDKTQVEGYQRLDNSIETFKSYILSDDIVSLLTEAVVAMNSIKMKEMPLGEPLNIHNVPANGTEQNLPAWKRFFNHIRRHRLYDVNDSALDEVMHNMRTLPIEAVTLPPGGSQLKFLFHFSDKSQAVVKFQRYSIDHEAREDTFPWDDMERFNAEVAGFHLDRLLGFNHVPPVVTRYVNLTSEKHLLPPEHQKTFYKSIAGNVCFYGPCLQFCDTNFGICGKPDIVATSLSFYISDDDKLGHHGYKYPWMRVYRLHGVALWEGNDTFCRDTIAEKPDLYNNTRTILDLMDMAIFDFLQLNMDRKDYSTFRAFGTEANMILIDNGRAFPHSGRDEIPILSPIKQCCMIRQSTLDRLWKFYTDDVKLSTKMKQSLKTETETIQPLLTDKHLSALDRRLKIVLEAIHDCIVQSGMNFQSVIKDDGF